MHIRLQQIMATQQIIKDVLDANRNLSREHDGKS